MSFTRPTKLAYTDLVVQLSLIALRYTMFKLPGVILPNIASGTVRQMPSYLNVNKLLGRPDARSRHHHDPTRRTPISQTEPPLSNRRSDQSDMIVRNENVPPNLGM